MVDLWPEDITEVKVKAPVTILKEQGTVLGEKTQHIVEADVVTTRSSLISGKDFEFAYTFYIRAPALGDYKYELFVVAYGVSMYPVKIDLDNEIKNDIKANLRDYKETVDNWGTSGLMLVDSESEFVTVLKEIFSSKKTRQIIQAIVAQSR